MKLRAEKLAGASSSGGTGGSPRPSALGFLLDRGTVAFLHTAPNGRLADVGLLDRSTAAPAALQAAIMAPAAYSTFMDATPESRGDTQGFTLKTDLPLVSWESRFQLHPAKAGAGVDMAGIEGDLRGARYRWELAPSTDGKKSQITWRAKQDLAASSITLKVLFGQEPSFEHGFNVGLGMNALYGIRARAEGKK
jgi:hypothetical protein